MHDCVAVRARALRSSCLCSFFQGQHRALPLIVFPRRRYKDGVPVARQTPDPRLRNRRCKDGVPAVRQTPDPRPLVFPRRRRHAFDCGSFQRHLRIASVSPHVCSYVCMMRLRRVGSSDANSNEIPSRVFGGQGKNSLVLTLGFC